MLHLSPINTVDPHQLQVMADNYEIARYLKDIFPHPYTLKDAHAFLQLANEGMMGYCFAIYAGNLFAGIGSIQPQQDIYKVSGEIGYWIGQPFQGRGYGTETVKKLVSFAFRETELTRLFAGVFSNNSASMRVLEKAGFTREAIFKQSIIKHNQLLDEHVFTLLKTSYAGQS